MKLKDFQNSNVKSILKKNSLSYDLVIIGSGFAAYTIARKLHKKKKILLIEKGNLKLKKLQKKNLLNEGKIHLKTNTLNEIVGGTSHTWSGNLCEYAKNEFDTDNKKNWPIKNELIFYYKEAWKILGIYFRSKNIIKEINQNLVQRKIIAQYFPMRILSKLMKLNVDIIINANVEGIGEKINPFIKINNNIFYFKKIIVANGGLGSIKLIKNSVTSRLLKLNINTKFIGNGYMNHPKFKIKKFIIPKLNDNILSLYEKNSYYFYGYSLNEKIQKTKQLNNTYCRLHPRYIDEKKYEFKVAKFFFSNKKLFLTSILNNNNVFKKKFKQELKLNSKLSIYKILINFRLYYYLLFFFGFLKLKVAYYDLEYFFELSCYKKNSIKFYNNSIISNINLSRKDKETFSFLHSELVKYLSINHQISKNNYNINLSRVSLLDASHHIGGLNFANFTKKGFIDKNCKLNNSKNIFICSSSIFPTAGSGNPTLTIISLALKISNFLLNLDKSKKKSLKYNKF